VELKTHQVDNSGAGLVNTYVLCLCVCVCARGSLKLLVAAMATLSLARYPQSNVHRFAGPELDDSAAGKPATVADWTWMRYPARDAQSVIIWRESDEWAA